MAIGILDPNVLQPEEDTGRTQVLCLNEEYNASLFRTVVVLNDLLMESAVLILAKYYELSKKSY